MLWTHAGTNSMIKQKPEGRRPKEERRRKKEETEQEGWWTSQLRSPPKGLPPRDSLWCVLEAASRDRSRPAPHGEPSGYGEVITLPFPPIAIASLRTVCQRCCTPLQKIEVLHLFRCSTYTHTHTHTPVPCVGDGASEWRLGIARGIARVSPELSPGIGRKFPKPELKIWRIQL